VNSEALLGDAPISATMQPGSDVFDAARAWFATQGWAPFPFQEEVWTAFAGGESGLLHAPTGMGKTYAAWIPPLVLGPVGTALAPPPLTALWVTPLRALAADTGLALARAARALQPHWTVDVRTGDTASSARARQNRQLPTALVTTPESLTLLQARADWRERLAHVSAVIVDEWHELMSSKRGVQVELALARLRTLRPELRVWGLSATLANLDEALACLTGVRTSGGRIVKGLDAKSIEIATAHPATIDRFPWAGHIGLKMLPEVIRAIDSAQSTLVFTNVRSATEIWYQAILAARPDWAGRIALHHGSLERDVRDWVEEGLRRNKLKAVVCTSSLDLGVDFTPVDQVLQIGSPKGVARLLQRAGRRKPVATFRDHAFDSGGMISSENRWPLFGIMP
jgi:ATP-dependent Lhr-like helicase